MQPIGPLMIEHRLIEKMIRMIKEEAERLHAGGALDAAFLEVAVDFVRTYADRTHHGKEEDILFRDLAKKPLEPHDRKVMGELIEEHVRARAMVKGISAVMTDTSGTGVYDAAGIAAKLEELAAFYPPHIVKEDKHFFPAAMRYLNADEQAAMLHEFGEFDRQLIHEKYRIAVSDMGRHRSRRTHP